MAACCYVAILLMFAAFQRSLMYPATKSAEPLLATNYRFGVDLADAETTTSDGITLHGWYAKRQGEADEARPLILFSTATAETGCTASTISICSGGSAPMC